MVENWNSANTGLFLGSAGTTSGSDKASARVMRRSMAVSATT
ncbi:hypothetical protein ACNF49_32125 [Actinomadura sp. ATCC 39365]